MNSQDVFDIASAAVDALAKDRGRNAFFPFDAIWGYAADDVPSTLRPTPRQRLVKDNYLKVTGRMTRAETGPRAGSPTTEYTPGSRYQPTAPPPQPSVTNSVVSQIESLAHNLTDRGFIISADQLANFYLALRTSPLVILAGASGTGKSLLPRLFSEAVDARFAPIQVQPQWADNADLMGYTPTLTPDKFVPGRLTDALEAAALAPDQLVIALLDEMNLAQVEHYFSDFLSVVESRRREQGKLVTDRLPLDLPSLSDDQSVDHYAELRRMIVPSNIRVVGTANMDETTQAFSPKVLDRAFTIEFGQIDLAAFATVADPPPALKVPELGARIADESAPVTVTEALAEAHELFGAIAGLLIEVNDILAPVDASFAYRTRDAICLYMWHWRSDELSSLLPGESAFDYCLLQKVLPHIRGHGDSLQTALQGLLGWLQRDDSSTGTQELVKRPYLRSAAKVERMIARLVEDGATTYWER